MTKPPSSSPAPRMRIPAPDKPPRTANPQGQVCQKCGARFRWERENGDLPKSPLVLRLLEPSAKCDCGYGRGPGRR